LFQKQNINNKVVPSSPSDLITERTRNTLKVLKSQPVKQPLSNFTTKLGLLRKLSLKVSVQIKTKFHRVQVQLPKIQRSLNKFSANLVTSIPSILPSKDQLKTFFSHEFLLFKCSGKNRNIENMQRSSRKPNKIRIVGSNHNQQIIQSPK
jgi:hypothetical protein